VSGTARTLPESGLGDFLARSFVELQLLGHIFPWNQMRRNRTYPETSLCIFLCGHLDSIVVIPTSVSRRIHTSAHKHGQLQLSARHYQHSSVSNLSPLYENIRLPLRHSTKILLLFTYFVDIYTDIYLNK